MNYCKLILIAVVSVFLALTASAQTNQAGSPGTHSKPAKTKSFSVQVTGHGTGMILIPGLTCGGDVWNSTVEHFKDHYECHSLTLAGFAGQPAIGPPMLETIRKDIAAYIREKKLSHPVIVGHSLGGFLAFWLSSAEPSLVGPVISVDGGTFFPALMNPDATAESSKSSAEFMRQMTAGQSPEQFAANNKMFLAGMITDPKNLEWIAPTCAKSDPKAVGLAMYEIMTTDLRKDVAQIRAPVLLVGSADMATSAEMKKTFQARYEAQVAKVPNHKVVMAEKAKHFIMLDEPNFLWSAMEDFLRSSEAR